VGRPGAGDGAVGELIRGVEGRGDAAAEGVGSAGAAIGLIVGEVEPGVEGRGDRGQAMEDIVGQGGGADTVAPGSGRRPGRHIGRRRWCPVVPSALMEVSVLRH
jgi:hypothetical protein